MAATMKDIAKRTGLGLATISSYFNGGNVREKNRVKIEEAIEELHYEVNEVARGLKTNATKTIGVVIPELNNTFCAEIITGMEDVLRSHGYATIVCDCRTDKKLERDAVEFLSRKRVDGIISMPVDAEGNHLKKFQKTGKPIVLIDRRIQELSCDSVLVDNEKAAEDAMRVFFKAGHRKIGIIGGPEEISTAQERLQGYRSAYEKENLPCGWKPYYIYLIMVDHIEVGRIVLREGSNEERYYDGHIGYTIEKEYRGHHYSKDACLLLFDKAKEKGFKQLMITCSPDNIASRKIIESLPFKYLETKEVPACLKKDFDQGDYIKRIYCLDLEEL